MKPAFLILLLTLTSCDLFLPPDPSLSGLSITPGSLDSQFSPTEYSYSGITQANHVFIYAVAKDYGGEIKGSGNKNLSPGMNTLYIESIARDSISRKFYTINLLYQH